MDSEWEEWQALAAQNPGNLTDKGISRLNELENKFGLAEDSCLGGHPDNQ